MLCWLRPSSNESGLLFGLSWSAAGFLIAITGLSSCAYLIPEDDRPPRYNTVLGQRRPPILNNAVGANTPDPELPVAKQVQSAPRAPAERLGAAPRGAPATAGTSSAAVRSSVGQPGGVAENQERSFYERSRDWIFGDDAEIGEAPVPLGAPLPPGVSNETEDPESLEAFQQRALLALGGGRDYPELETVPPADKAALLTKDKLQQAQRALEIDKQRAAREQFDLQLEASEGPSLLDAYESGELQRTPNTPDASGAYDGSLLDQAAPTVPAPPPAQTVNVVRGTSSQLVTVE